MADRTLASTDAAAFSVISGPTLHVGSMPSPTFRERASAAKRSQNSSNTDSWTRKRSAHTHVCPVLRNLLATAAATAWSMSASSNTMNGALPPNSNDKRFMVSLLSFINSFPTRVEPVKLIFLTFGLVHSSVPTFGVVDLLAVTSWNTSSGMPALSDKFFNAIAVSGVNSLGFTMAVHPAASAGATLRVIIAAGKFHGVIKPVTPTACWVAISCPFGAP
mmetsp:Transcript_19123/g.54311  ORF Transcript_19123/g.54311 Transcript_19123/m.54311 type:complete len:219 (-) Transcript_19123:57-713(-)